MLLLIHGWLPTVERVSFYEIPEIFAVAYNRTATVEISVNGFRACGLWPFNDCIFSDEDHVEVATEEQQCSRQAFSLSQICQIMHCLKISGVRGHQKMNSL